MWLQSVKDYLDIKHTQEPDNLVRVRKMGKRSLQQFPLREVRKANLHFIKSRVAGQRGTSWSLSGPRRSLSSQASSPQLWTFGADLSPNSEKSLEISKPRRACSIKWTFYIGLILDDPIPANPTFHEWKVMCFKSQRTVNQLYYSKKRKDAWNNSYALHFLEAWKNKKRNNGWIYEE